MKLRNTEEHYTKRKKNDTLKKSVTRVTILHYWELHLLSLKFAFRKTCWKHAFLSTRIAQHTEENPEFSSDTLLEDKKKKQRMFMLLNLAMPIGDWSNFCVLAGPISKEAFTDQGERDCRTGNLLNMWFYSVLCTFACLHVKRKQQTQNLGISA